MRATIPTAATDYPTRVVRMIEPFGPGSGPQVIAAAVSRRVAELWGQPVTVENHPGAGSTAAPAMVAKSPADGRKPPGGPGAWRPLSISSNQSWRTRRRATLRSHASCARQSQPSAGRYALPSQIYARATGPRDLCDHPPAQTTPLHERMKVVIL